MYDLVIKNGAIITCDSSDRVVEKGFVAVSGDKIAQVASADDIPVPDASKVLDALGGIIMPGLVNAHTHLPMTLFRGLADDLALADWLNNHIFPAEAAHIKKKTVAAGTLLACGEMLLNGTTTCCDGYFLEDEVAKAVNLSGMRAVLGQGVIGFPAPGAPDPEKGVAVAGRFVSQWKKAENPLIRPSIFCHSPYTCSAKTIQEAKQKANELGVLFQIHAAETRFERDNSISTHGKSPIAYLNSLGVLDSNTLVIHSIWVDEADAKILASSRASVCICPSSHTKLASGIAPIKLLEDAGVCVALGTDGPASNNSADMFREMGLAARLGKILTHDPTQSPADRVIRMATVDAAKAVGLGSITGSLEVGKQADIILVDTNSPHLTPCYNSKSLLVYSACGADVSMVLVAGRIVVQNKKLLTFGVEAAMASVAEIAKRIAGKNESADKQ
ncbi:MAG: amidohydrolase [Desulfatibacillaceae bacterium]|nr:amidohydrolase [Desulfatibacillaceae bacterium]